MIDRLVVINDLSDPKGGASALALEGALACRRRGLNVSFLSGDKGSNPLLAEHGINSVALGGARLDEVGAARGALQGLYNRDARRMIAAWMAEHDTPGTVYHVHGWAQILSPAIFGALSKVLDRVVLHAHDFFLTCPNGSYSFLRTGAVCPLVPMSRDCVTTNCDRRSYPQKLWRVARQGLLNGLLNRREVPLVLAIHEAMRPFLVRGGMPDGAIRALPNPVMPFSARRIAAEKNREFLFVGRLEATKGPDLAAAAARVAGVTIRFVGDGEMRQRLVAEYPDMVFTGRLPRDLIGAEAQRARALVMPSRYPEPYGLVAAEALWSGLPVIAAKTAFVTGDIVRAGAGIGVDPRDTNAFAAVLRMLADDDGQIAAMSEAAMTDTGDIGLTPERWVDKLIEAYEERLVSAGGRC